MGSTLEGTPDAYNGGYQAYYGGKAITSNPHAMGSQAHQQWEQGWEDGEEDDDVR